MSRVSGRAASAVGSLVIAVAPVAGAQGPPALPVPMLADPPRLDGRLDETVWTRAAVARGFTQREPRSGEPAQEATEVRLFYDADHLYVGARLSDSQAGRIVASEYVRDANLDANDAFEVMLDTFHDGRNAFYFQTNAVGARRDALIRNEGDAINWEWDGVWDVAAHRDADGWTVEIAIPFSTLRFRPGVPDGWGANFGRSVARSREETFWAPIARDLGYLGKWRVSAYGALTGLEGARRSGRLQIKPFGLGGSDQDADVNPGDPDATLEVGLDAKVAVTSTLIADLTLNTDFAQVEADQQQLNLTRFPLFFPEKREFFLENAGMFQVGERLRPFEPPSTLLFFSRRIGLTEDGDEVPLVGGARLTGKLGHWDVGALDIVADETVVPGDEDEGPVRVPRTNFAALRLKRDVRARSSVGAMVLAKSPADEGPSNQVVAADATLAVSPSTSMTAFAAQSFTPGLTGSAHAASVDASFETDRLSLAGAYLDVGDDFNSEMGFVQRTGIRKFRGSVGVARRPDWPGVRQAFVFDDHSYVTNRRGVLESQVNFLGTGAFLDNGGFVVAGWQNLAEGLTEPFEIRDGVEVPIGRYRFDQAFAFFELDRSRRVSASGTVAVGTFYDGTLQSYLVGTVLRPHGRLTIAVDYNRNVVSLPVDGGEFATNLAIARAAYAFSTHAFLRGLVQVNDDEEEARINLLFRYTYRPGSDLFVVYNEDRGIRGKRPHLLRRQLLVKATYYWVPR